MNRLFKKMLGAAGALSIVLTCGGFKAEDFSPANFKNYKREFKSQSIGACSSSSTKTYEDYRMITATGSRQYQYIHNHMTVDPTTGLLYNEDGFIGVALGYAFGEIGTRYYVVLDTGVVLPVVKVDAKASIDATNGCSHDIDSSVVELVIDSDIAFSYFGGGNGLANNGNFNNYEYFRGNIVDFELVLDEKYEEGIIYQDTMEDDPVKKDAAQDGIQFVEGGF